MSSTFVQKTGKRKEKFVSSTDRKSMLPFFSCRDYVTPLSFWAKMWYSLSAGKPDYPKGKKYMKRLFVWMLVLCLMLTACGGNAEEETNTVQTQETIEYTIATPAVTEGFVIPTEEATEATEPPVEENPNTINPLTGEVLAEPSNARPFAIMLNNHKAALPHHGVSQADIVYETLVEGGMTRYMALFTDPASVSDIGSVRSCRPPYVGFVQAYDAIYSSASGDQSVLNMITSQGVDYINALVYEGSYFYRNQNRLNRGIAWEHTLFVTGEDFYQLAVDREMRTTRKEGQTYGLNFDDAVVYEGDSANTVKIYFQPGGKTTTCTYDAEKGGYTLFQNGLDYVDGNTDELVAFRNVLVLEAESYVMSNGVHVYMENVGEGPGYYARDGVIIPITWSRAGEDEPYSYKTADGQELVMGVGTSYIAVISDGSPVEFE